MKILLATNNKHKVNEIKNILRNSGLRFLLAVREAFQTRFAGQFEGFSQKVFIYTNRISF